MAAIPVFVVSLARATERRRDILAHLRHLGVDHQVLDAVDGHAIPAAERRALQAPDVDYQPGVLGCYLSHMELYRRFLATDAPVALALEDDARLNRDFVPALARGLGSLDFDYCFLDYARETEGRPVFYDRSNVIEIHPGFQAYLTDVGPATTHAYLITRAAAERRLAFALPIHRPVDIYTPLPYRPRFRALVGRPGAGVSDWSMTSEINPDQDHRALLSRRWLRQLPGYYWARNLLNLETLRLRFGVHALQRCGVLPASGQWRPLPPGRQVWS